ncbi:MAG: ribonuclease R [Candidatus Tectomicrobia bacterium]|uniref:Ribonuclease R n=1 Tax=Tectimicrobiota bacterium TaxID=2528274 RepID=A0A932ZX59_UNCTE|nr:ribonuclease R [Candidatus Tectomicrobia bacterium]
MSARRFTPPTDPELLALLAREGRAMAVREVIRLLGVPADQRPALRKRMRALAEEGKLVRMRARFALPASLSIVRGLFRGHRSGIGFVIPGEDGEEKKGADILIGRARTRGALDGDTVAARVEKVQPDGRREGSVLDVIERGRAAIVGRFMAEGRRAWVEPQEERLPHLFHVTPSGRGEARQGEWVEAEITRYPAHGQDPQCRVLRSFGYPEDPAAEQKLIIAKWGLAEEFPRAALAEAEGCRPPAEDDPLGPGEEDLRALEAFTIDPRTARDRDDAVSIERLPGGGWRLGVHIADVGRSVPEGSAMDAEAARRGNSVYFPDRALPMLPPRVTGEVCSLAGGAARRTLSAFLDFDAQGLRRGVRFTFGRIRSRASLTYEGAGAVLDEGVEAEPGEREAAVRLEGPLRGLWDLAGKLHARRMAEGSLDFDLPEAFVLLDRKGGPLAIQRSPRNRAHRLIEECMLAANRAVAEYLGAAGETAVYRVHEPPQLEKLQALRLVLTRLGLPVPAAEDLLQPGRLQRVLDAVRGREPERYVNLIALRSMKLARYASAPALHFGLGFDRYTHFTSPIRRYADLLVHRRLARLLRGDRRKPDARAFARHCEEISGRERAAEGAEREMVDFHKALYMKGRIGERFAGHVSGVTAFGLFVELEESFVEGMCPLEWLADDYYAFLPEEFALLGRRTGKRFRLGDPVTVRVEGVDLARRQVSLRLLAGGTHEAAPGEEGARRLAGAFGMRRPQRGKRPPREEKPRGKRRPGGRRKRR